MNDNNDDKNNKNNKEEWNKKYTLIAIYSFIVILASFAAILVILGVRDFFAQQQYLKIFKILTPIIYGFVFAYLLSPLLTFFQSKIFFKLSKKMKNIFAILSTYLTMAIIITLLLLMVIPQVVLSVQQLTGRATDWLSPYESESGENNKDIEDAGESEKNDAGVQTKTEPEPELEPESENDNKNDIANSKIVVYLNDLGASIQDYIDNMGLRINVEETFRDMTNNMVNLLSSYVMSAINGIVSILYGIFSGILNFILGILLSIYLLISKDKFIAQIKKIFFALFPSRFAYKVVNITRRTHEVFGKFITGKILDCAIVGILCFIGMSILRLRYAALISVIIAVCNLIPFFGPIIGAVPSVFFLAINDIWQALWFLIFILVLQQIDGNIIDPKISGSRVGLPTFWVIVAIIITGGLFGPLAIIFGVPIFAVAYVLIKEYAEDKLVNKGFPAETEQYIRTPGSNNAKSDNLAKNNAGKTGRESKSVFFGKVLYDTAGKIMGIFSHNKKNKNEDSNNIDNDDSNEDKKDK